MSTRQAKYQRYLQSWRWRVISSSRRWVDRNRCRTCKSCPGERLNVHHASYAWCGRGGWLWWIFWATLYLYLVGWLPLALVAPALLVGGYGWFREWNDCLTVCKRCHQGIHRGRSIREFED